MAQKNLFRGKYHDTNHFVVIIISRKGIDFQSGATIRSIDSILYYRDEDQREGAPHFIITRKVS